MGDTEVVIAGGGPAGCAVAAALSDLGWSVLLLDAGVDRHKQLAGELLHPPGVRDLRALGFGDVVDGWAAHPVRGFAVRFHAPARTLVLPYGRGVTGLSLEHAALTLPLLESVSRRRGVTVCTRARVTAVEHNCERGVRLRYSHEGTEHTVHARLLVAADGRASPVRRMLGIAEHHQRLSTMLGVTVDSACLTHPEHGHQFVGGAVHALAYTIQPGVARVMVDLPLGSTAQTLKEQPELLLALPSRLREAVRQALEQRPAVRMASNDDWLAETVWMGSAVLVGDAAACCHPLTASGMASCFHDARALQESLDRYPGHVARALEHYAHARRPAQRTRVALASALYSAFARQDEGMHALRMGLLHYWEHSPGGARASMALLSSEEPRMRVMAREYLRVVAHAFAAMLSPNGTGGSLRSAAPLLRSAGPPLRGTVASAVEQVGSWLHRRVRRPVYTLARAGWASPRRAFASNR
ncbi:monooxygenase family protein [Corallococcus coralloides DSM 2259]|uniref:squalene monooxygenase n=1 Tax=Corallococcus coralloides (strain ATCC 25202 / DSM 2259 / NBRC 100086 / M2) TaxID=1144275 RepID=H8N1G7_CORCM|nr:NAD(P)/FAD-dependent oxidoreductase [Corallococcus coralloides]AFE10591.1 monooxygenase family protein [Corallococcus coralloides DSM 2259]